MRSRSSGLVSSAISALDEYSLFPSLSKTMIWLGAESAAATRENSSCYSSEECSSTASMLG